MVIFNMNSALPSTFRGCPLASTDPVKSFRSSLPLSVALFSALLHQSEAFPPCFQSLAHSLRVYPGWHRVPGFVLANPGRNEERSSDFRSLLSALKSALAGSPLVTPLESALTKKTE